LNKRLKISVLILIISSIFVISSIIIVAKNDNLIKSTTGKVIDIELVKKQKELKTEKNNYKEPGKKVVLDVKWGEGEDEFKMSTYQEASDTDVSYSVPASYTIDNKGNVYVYDTLNSKIKVFNDNKLVNSILVKNQEMKIETRSGEFINSMTPHVLKDMAIDTYGNIYAVCQLTNKALRIDASGAIEECFKQLEGEERVNRPEMIEILPSGNIMVQDNIDSVNTTRVRKFDINENVISSNQLSNYIDFSLYQYENSIGDTVSINRVSPFTNQIEFKNKKDNSKSVSNYTVEPDKETEVSKKLLGCDDEGRLYFWVEIRPLTEKMKELGSDRYWQQSKEYIDRVDVKNDLIDTIRLEHTNWSMSNSTANSQRYIRIDNSGSVYQLQISKNSYKIIRYSFE